MQLLRHNLFENCDFSKRKHLIRDKFAKDIYNIQGDFECFANISPGDTNVITITGIIICYKFDIFKTKTLFLRKFFKLYYN